MKPLIKKNAILIFLVFAAGYLYSQDNQIKREGANSNEESFTIVDDMPVFIEGEEKLSASIGNYIAENLLYPDIARANNIVGRVFVQFVVDPEGMVKDAKVIRGVDKCLDDEALRVINCMPRWASPGKKDGAPVSVSFTVPISFYLTNGDE